MLRRIRIKKNSTKILVNGETKILTHQHTVASDSDNATKTAGQGTNVKSNNTGESLSDQTPSLTCQKQVEGTTVNGKVNSQTSAVSDCTSNSKCGDAEADNFNLNGNNIESSNSEALVITLSSMALVTEN